jgi:HK97 family phage prohead protease
MRRIEKSFMVQVQSLGPRSILITCSSGAVDRTGEVVDQKGIDLSDYNDNPIVLWSHNPEHPVGNASAVQVIGGKLQAQVDFFPEGLSHKADEVCGLYKGGFVRTVSIGFDVTEAEPMDPRNPRGPQRYLKTTLLEISLVCLPANTDAVVIQRARKSGRVISQANRSKLQQAHDAAEQARSIVADVLDTVEGGDPAAGGPNSAEEKAKRLRRVRALGLALPPARIATSRVRSRSERLAVAAALESQSYGADPELWPIYRAAESVGMHMTECRARQILSEAKQLHRPADHHTRAVFARMGR